MNFIVKLILLKGSRFLIGSLLLTGVSIGQMTYEGKSNPHGKDDCTVCHLSGQEPAANTLLDDPCSSCHDPAAIDAKIHHLSHVDPGAKAMRLPADFKLGDDGKMDCLTCHDVVCKVDRSNRSFLRGGPYRRELDFCYNCHQDENYAKTNPHIQIQADGSVDQTTCLQCHVEQPDLMDHKTIASEMHADMASTCNKCHALHSHEQNHQGKNIELSKKATIKRFRQTQKSFGVNLPLSKDNLIQCNTCHYTHNRGTLAQDQVVYEGTGDNPRYLRLAKENLCYACHDL